MVSKLLLKPFVQPHSLNVSQQRLIRQGPSKTKEHKCKHDGSDTDHWGPGGVVYFSEFEDNDADLLQHLKSNADFIVTMTDTAAFTDTTMSYLIFLFFLFFVQGHPQLALSEYWAMCWSSKIFELWTPKIWGCFATGEEIFAPWHNFWDVPILRGMVWCTSDWAQSFATWACVILDFF